MSAGLLPNSDWQFDTYSANGKGDNVYDKEKKNTLPVMFLLVMENIEFTHNKSSLSNWKWQWSVSMSV